MAEIDFENPFVTDPSAIWNPQAPKMDPNNPNGEYKDWPSPSGLPVPAPGGTPSSIDDLERIYGIQAGATDRENLAGKNPEDRDQFLRDLNAQFYKRATPTSSRSVDSQSVAGNTLYGSGTGNRTNTPGGPMTGAGGGGATVTPFSNPTPQFSDPSAQLVENYALDRFRQRQNPDPNSGTALYENYLRRFAGTLEGAPYSPTEEAQIKQGAYNALEQERTATKQRWLEEVSRRGMLPSSGVALDGLRRIDEHYGRIRAESDNTFATNAINLTRQNRAQAAGVYGSLASNEEGRLSDALTYAMLPLSLQDRSFNQGLALMGAAGPADSRSALALLGLIQNQNQYNSANRAANMEAIFKLIAEALG